jgi:hypothetical protein
MSLRLLLLATTASLAAAAAVRTITAVETMVSGHPPYCCIALASDNYH